ncbi:MAG: penicillin-binding transpeptidase domain-containing protein [Acidobacteriota bacterium]|nr:penicillin-binding transpeptidase domain-containing protein [Acidobacteriota bacterium]
MLSIWSTRSGRAVATALLIFCLVLQAFPASISTRRESRGNRKVKESASTERRMAASRHSRPVTSQKASKAQPKGKAAGKTKAAAKGGKAASRMGKATSRAEVAEAPKKGAKGLRTARGKRPAKVWERFTASSYDGNPEAGDLTAGEDPAVRRAAVDALGTMNGTVVAIDPSNGRILAMVNQKLALSSGAQPCSTIKISVALAALSEGIVTKDTPVKLGNWQLNMNQALAHSNNMYFETLGRRLGFQKVSYYAHQYGLGELAGWNIPGERLGTYPTEEIPASEGGVGRMCSFGEGVSMTPLQLGALLASLANGGTLYYLQHPRNATEATHFQPRVKRYLDIAPLIPEVSEGMLGATQYGTARKLRTSFTAEDVFGKTGTCSNDGTRFGWFGSFTTSQYGRIVTVIFLQGDHAVFGPKAAELAGRFYRNLEEDHYFAGNASPVRAASAR